VDMGVEPYLLPSALVGVLAQRLVRRLCKVCREPIPDAQAEFDKAKVTVPDGRPVRLWKGVGCSACNSSGYKGRQGVFELMLIDETYHQAIVERASTSEFHRLAKWHGMRNMFDDGVIRATDGVTTLDELLRVTRNEAHTNQPTP
jgi:type II secretory ATPase GspE/PulE/Tfp pilus assembly ATPase PilB-like protein